MTGFVQKHQKAIFLSLLALVSAGAGWYIVDCTQYAPWGFSDSAAYLSAARNFAAGNGLGIFNPDGSYAPLLIFAPFYSLFLSLFALFNADLIVTVRIMDIVFFALLVAASGWLFYLITRSFWGSLCFAIMITTTPVLGTLFTSMMSEPLAIVLGIPGFLLLIYALKQNSTKWLVVSAVLAALALLTRYAFAAFPAAGVVCVLLLSNQRRAKRISDTLKYCIISFTPMLVWIALQLFSKNSVGARTYSMDFSITEKFSQFITQVFAVLKYWLPYRTDMIPGVPADVFRPILLLLFAAIIVLGLFFGIKKHFSPERHITGFLIIGFVILILLYLLVLFVTYMVSTETISIDDRMLSPVIPIFYALILSCALSIGQAIHPRVTFPFVAVIVALFFVVYNYQPFKAYPIVVGNIPNGYTSPVWMENPILSGEIALPQDRPLITNAPDILLFYTNRSAYTLSVDSISTLTIGGKTSLDDLLHQECAVLVLFDTGDTQRFEQLPNAPTAADVATLQSQLDSLYSSSHGAILADNNCSG
ncbi:MAG: hypothetical protein CVU43_09605 [Chloroflexi bacterium HGW-Chloroflexi-5]|jgi:hypothetical protein|nr:MAG: hypothetical protein CVU43_09605 [Chloroflexi bacterium HGW-Chloroflexi-5]